MSARPPGQIGGVFGFVRAGWPLGSAVTPVAFGMLIEKGHAELLLVAVILLPSLHGFGASLRPVGRGGGTVGGMKI